MSETIHDISVIICAYTEDRWNDLISAVESVRQQTLPATEIIIVIDHNPDLLKRIQEQVDFQMHGIAASLYPVAI